MRNRFIEDLLKKTRQKRLLKRVIAGLSVIVIFVTFNTFKYNAMTLERTSMCGYEDHEHGPECFDAEGGLICELHAHTDACFQEAPRADLSLDAMMAGGASDDVSSDDASENLPDAPAADEDPADALRDGAFVVGEQYPVYLSRVLDAEQLNVAFEAVEDIGQVLASEDERQRIRIERLENDYAIYPLEGFEELELAVVTRDDVYLLKLADAVAPAPTAEPTAEPTEEPTAEPTVEPTAEPTEEPTAEPTIEPTEEPTVEPTVEPTAEPTEEPTAVPTIEPTEEPTVEPTEEPTIEPTVEPTEEPTAEPTEEPTIEPTVEPTEEPTAVPTVEPTEEPTVEPTEEPTIEPTVEPTEEPTAEPTEKPTIEPTVEPTEEPTAEPTEEPTAEPTIEPTEEPTVEPTAEPTIVPTEEPTAEPTVEPTVEPTEEPTIEPTAEPTAEPTVEPTEEPTAEPTEEPTVEPTVEPTEGPTAEPTEEPTVEPTHVPTVEPTEEPTAEPTAEPTVEPTIEPTEEPTVEPTNDPETAGDSETTEDPESPETDDSETADADESDPAEDEASESADDSEKAEESDGADDPASADADDTESTEESDGTDDLESTEESDGTDDSESTEESDGADDPASADADDTESTEESDGTDDTESTEESDDADDSESTEESDDTESTEESDDVDDTEITDSDDLEALESLDEDAGDAFAAGAAFAAVIDVSGMDAPFSLRALMAQAEPTESEPASEPADAQPDVEDAQEAPVEVVEEDGAEDAPAEPLEPAEWEITYNNEDIAIAAADGDYLIVPMRGFERTEIIVNNGAAYALALENWIVDAEPDDPGIPWLDLGLARISAADGENLPSDAQGHADVVSGEDLVDALNRVKEYQAAQLAPKPMMKKAMRLAAAPAAATATSAAPATETRYQAFEIGLDNAEAIESGYHVEVSLPRPIAGAGFRLFHIHDGEVTPVDAFEQELVMTLEGEELLLGFAFDTENFSQFVLSYTVDLHYDVDGQSYEFTLSGGDSVSFRDLVTALHVPESIPRAENEAPMAVDDFMAAVTDVVFSDESLVWVARVDADATAGELIARLGLEPQYSAELTPEQLDAMAARAFTAPDWALISLRPFLSRETLTVTMNNGETFVIRVTDDQLKRTVISDGGEAYEVIVTYGEDAGIPDGSELCVTPLPSDGDAMDALRERAADALADRLEGVPGHPTLFDISIVYGDQVIEPAPGSDVQVEIRLLKDAVSGLYTDEDSPLLINDVPVSADEQSMDRKLEIIHDVRGAAPEFVTLREETDDETLVARFATDSFSDWLLFLDEDLSEITIGRNDTLTLRPYTEWVWKKTEEPEDYQTAQWSFPSNWVSWNNDNNWRDPNSIISFERKSKHDDQIDETYIMYHGKATRTGDFEIQVKNADGVMKTITVHVVNDVPDIPPVITNAADMKINLYDYDYNVNNPSQSGNLDREQNVASNSDNSSVNKYSDLKFLGYGGSNTTDNWFLINNYTKEKANQGIVARNLNSYGYPVLAPSPSGGRSQPNLNYLFEDHGNDVKAYKNVNGLFQFEDGYYYYNSNSNYAWFDKNNWKMVLYEHTYTQMTQGSDGANAKPIGFFPFHQYDSSLSDTFGMNFNKSLNHHFGMDMSVQFEIPSDGLDDYGNPITFEFSGDDDMWVFVDGVLVMDVGGIHQPVTGSINFSADKVNVYGANEVSITEQFRLSNSGKTWQVGDGKVHTLQVFYLERGGCDSNLSLKFNVPTRFAKGKLSLYKSDTNDKKPLKGAKFAIWNNPECAGDPIRTGTTDSKGALNFGDFVLGSTTECFYLRETEAPDGYIRDTGTYTIRPRVDGDGNPVKYANSDYIILDVYNSENEMLTRLTNDAIDFPNSKVPKLNIPVKKEWPDGATDGATVKLTLGRYKLIDVTKGFMIIKDLLDMPADYEFEAEYVITYPDGSTKTIHYSDFTDGVYSLLGDPAWALTPGDYTITERVTSAEPSCYHMEHTPETHTVTVNLPEDGTATAEFQTQFTPITGTLTMSAFLNNGGNSGINYNDVRYVVLDSTGRKLGSCKYTELANTTFTLPVGEYSVKAVNIPHKPIGYNEDQYTTYGGQNMEGTIRGNVTISENQNTHVDFHHSYVSVGVTNHWVVQDMYIYNGQRPVYGSGDVLLPKGARVQMTFTTNRDNVYAENNDKPTVTYNGQSLTPVVDYDNNQRRLFRVEFTVVDGATLDYRINAKKGTDLEFEGPEFKVLEEAHTSSVSGAKMMKSLRSPMLTAQGDEDNYVIDLTNTAGRADPPAGKKYVGDDWSQEVTLNSGNSWSEVLRGLDATDPEGNPYYYYVASVHEENLEAGTTCTIALDGDKKLLIGKDKNTTANLSVTNRVSKGSIQITKTVMKNGAVDTSANATFYYGVYAEDYGQNSSQLPLKTGSITVGSGDNGVKSVRVDGLALGTYYVYELTGPQGTPIQDGAWQTFSGTVYRVTGSGTSATAAETPPNVDLVNSTETVNVEVEKIWLDNNNEKGKRPESLKVTLSNGHEVTLNSGNSWKASVTGLPKYNASGEPIQYTWTEETLSGGYVPIGSSTDTTIENGVTTETTILKNGPDVHYNPLTSFVGTKTWVDDGTKRPEEIEIILYKGTGDDKQEVKRIQLEKPEEDSSEWSFEFENLPIFDEAGNAIQYSVDEVLPDGYILSFDLSNNAAPGYERDTEKDRVFVNEPNAEMEISTGVNLGFIVMKHGNDFIIWTPRKATDQEIAEIKQLVAGEGNAVGDEEFS